MYELWFAEDLESPDSSYVNNHYDPDVAHPNADYDDDLHVLCPPHTTERKLITKIDLRVIPVLSVLYLLAFLDRYGLTLRIRMKSLNEVF